MNDLSAFQRDTLMVIGGEGNPSGVEIMQVLGEYYENEVTGGRLYPNLDGLVNSGLVQKGKKDDRTNEYSLTERGHSELVARRKWEEELVEF